MPQKRTTKTGKNRWVARWRDPSGKEHSKSFDTRREAKAHEDEMDRARRLRTYLPHEMDGVTVRELFDMWLAGRDVRESTATSYKVVRDRQLGPLGDYPASKVVQADVQQWVDQLRSGRPWVAKGDRGLAESSAQYAARVLRSVLSYGVEVGVVAKNPARVPTVGRAVEPDDIPTIAEIRLVVDQLRRGGATYVNRGGGVGVQRPKPVVADMVVVGAMTGLRVSELAGLLVREVDFEAGVIRVRRQLAARSGERVELKTVSSRRDVPIAAELVPLLRRVAGHRAGGEFLFVGPLGRPVRAADAGLAVQIARDFVGADRVHFHALRHFFASQLLTARAPVQDVAAVLGHAGPATTLGVYAHVVEGLRDRVAGLISEAVGCGIFEGSPALRVVGGGV